MKKYGIPNYRGSHISNNEQIEAIGFDGEFWIMSDMWLLLVGPMSECWGPKTKVCEVDIKMLLKNVCVGPPNSASADKEVSDGKSGREEVFLSHNYYKYSAGYGIQTIGI